MYYALSTIVLLSCVLAFGSSTCSHGCDGGDSPLLDHRFLNKFDGSSGSVAWQQQQQQQEQPQEQQQTQQHPSPIASITTKGEDYALRNPRITTIEAYPARRGFNSISLPRGSVWCNGAPTYWIVGHQDKSESPWCLHHHTTQRNNNTTWVRNDAIVLDTFDTLNGKEKPIDRHSCVTIDVNRDGLPDIVCGVGADRGSGTGYNEIYITSTRANNTPTLVKVHDKGGLQKYPTMRNRFAVVLKNKQGVAEFVFLATLGYKRKDGLSNFHRMFRNNYTREGIFPYFTEVDGPWTNYLFRASCAVAADFTGDGRDDLVVCNRKGPPLLAVQQPPSGEEGSAKNGTTTATSVSFSDVTIQNQTRLKPYMQNWRKVRIADVTGDGLLDLVVVTYYPRLYIFKGIPDSPYFNFLSVFFEMKLPHAAPDVEVLDVNRDNVADIYVVQADESSNKSYCVPEKNRERRQQWWGDGKSSQPPADWTPPLDEAPDLLLIGGGGGGGGGGEGTAKNDHISSPLSFTVILLHHTLPGCGWIAQRFDNQTMLLGQGSQGKPGHSLLLEWQV